MITVCSNADATCPVSAGQVGKRVHIDFDEPSDAAGQRGGSGYVLRGVWRGDSVDSGIGLFLQRHILNGDIRSIPRVRYGQFSRL